MVGQKLSTSVWSFLPLPYSREHRRLPLFMVIDVEHLGSETIIVIKLYFTRDTDQTCVLIGKRISITYFKTLVSIQNLRFWHAYLVNMITVSSILIYAIETMIFFSVVVIIPRFVRTRCLVSSLHVRPCVFFGHDFCTLSTILEGSPPAFSLLLYEPRRFLLPL